jgi:thioredoxin 2
LDVDAGSFDGIVQRTRVPVMVDFWAAWCGPCRSAAPEVHALASEMAGRAVILKVDTERNSELANRFRVQGIPNFVVLRDGKMVFQQAGLVPREQMRRWLETASSSAA